MGRPETWLGALESTTLWSFVVLLLAVLNIGHGPDRDECLRFHQLNEMLRFAMGAFTADSCEPFSAYASDMLTELGSRVHIDIGERPIDALWRYLGDRACFPKLGHRPVWTETPKRKDIQHQYRATEICLFFGCMCWFLCLGPLSV